MFAELRRATTRECVWININNITSITPLDDGTIIRTTGGETIELVDSFESVQKHLRFLLKNC